MSDDDAWREFSTVRPPDFVSSFFNGSVFRKFVSFLLGLGGDETSRDTFDTASRVPATDSPNPITKARVTLKNIQEGNYVVIGEGPTAFATSDPQEGASALLNCLTRNGISASALDPEGKKSAAEMEAVIHDAPKQAYIARAKEYFASMTSRDGITIVIDGAAEDPRFHDGVLTDPRDIAKAVRAELERANAVALANGEKPVDASALKAGCGTNIEQVLSAQIREGYIAHARSEYEALKSDVRDWGVYPNGRSDHHNMFDKDIHDVLERANQTAKDLRFQPLDASVLDPEGKKSAAQMEMEIGNLVSPLDTRVMPKSNGPDRPGK